MLNRWHHTPILRFNVPTLTWESKLTLKFTVPLHCSTPLVFNVLARFYRGEHSSCLVLPIGIEPIHPGGPILQTGMPLQLHRDSIIIIMCFNIVYPVALRIERKRPYTVCDHAGMIRTPFATTVLLYPRFRVSSIYLWSSSPVNDLLITDIPYWNTLMLGSNQHCTGNPHHTLRTMCGPLSSIPIELINVFQYGLLFSPRLQALSYSLRRLSFLTASPGMHSSSNWFLCDF